LFLLLITRCQRSELATYSFRSRLPGMTAPTTRYPTLPATLLYVDKPDIQCRACPDMEMVFHDVNYPGQLGRAVSVHRILCIVGGEKAQAVRCIEFITAVYTLLP